MNDDPIIQQIRAVRHQISERCHHNPDDMITHYIELERRHPERFVDLTNQDALSDSDKRESYRLITPLNQNHPTLAS